MPSSKANDGAIPVQEVFLNAACGYQNNNSGPGTQINVDKIFTGHEEHDRFLRDLSTTDPSYDKKRIERTKGGLISNLNGWILHHEKFVDWHHGSQNRLLWITGDPGKGKTMLMCSIINHLQEVKKYEPVYFFCDAGDNRLNSANAVLRGLLYCFLSRYRSHITQFYDKFEKRGKALFEDANSWDVLVEMTESITSTKSIPKTLVVIDALDECTHELEQLLQILGKLSSDCKVVVSSRKYPGIESGLSALDDKVCMSLEDNETAVSNAVGEYILHKVNDLADKKRYNEAMREEVSAYLRSQADGTFLWVSVVYQQLAKATLSADRTMETLKAFPSGLNSLYRRILGQIMESPDRKLCRKILVTVCILHQPFNVTALAILLNKKEVLLKNAVKACCGLLVLKNDVVSFVHQSAKAFLQKEAERDIMPSGTRHENDMLLSRLVETMSITLRRNIYDLDGPGAHTSKANVAMSDPLADIRYACLYWTEHFSKANTMDKLQQDRIRQFLLQHCLHWIEAICHLRGVSKGIEGLSKVFYIFQELCSSKKPHELQNILWDARRLLQYFRQGIENNPLQIYQAALLFSPSRSIIGDMFREKELQGAKIIAEVGEGWSACLQSLEICSNVVSPMAFSPDGKTVASAYETKGVRIWKPTTGSHDPTLRGHSDKVHCLAFSQDGTTLISGSADGTIILWDTNSRQRKGTLHAPTAGVIFRCLVTHGTRLIAGSQDKTLRFWDLENEAYYWEVERVESYILALSNTGQTLASPSATGNVHLRNARTRKRGKTLTGHTGKIQALAFSNADHKLASASEDQTIKIWNPTTGECLITLRCKGVSSIAFSATNTQQLVSNSEGNKAIFWETTNGSKIRTLRSYSGSFESVSLKADGKMLASAATDKTVKLWDLKEDYPCQPADAPTLTSRPPKTKPDPERRGWRNILFDLRFRQRNNKSAPRRKDIYSFSYSFKQISSVTLSSNGQHAVVVDDATVTVWDTGNGRRIEKFKRSTENRKYTLPSVVYLDGIVYFAGYHDSEIHIWNITSDQCVTKIRNYAGVRSMAFSGDGTKFAASTGNKIKIWTTSTGKLKRDVQIQPPDSGRIKFSESGSHLHVGAGSFPLTARRHVNPQQSCAGKVEPDRYRVRPDRIWVSKGQTSVLWLPPEYRTSVWDAWGSRLVLGLCSRIVFIYFG